MQRNARGERVVSANAGDRNIWPTEMLAPQFNSNSRSIAMPRRLRIDRCRNHRGKANPFRLMPSWKGSEISASVGGFSLSAMNVGECELPSAAHRRPLRRSTKALAPGGLERQH